MPFTRFVDTALVEIVQLCQGQKVENTLYFQDVASELTAEKMQALGEAVLEWWDDKLSGSTTTASRIIEIKVTDLSAEDAPSVTIVPTGGQGVGGSFGDPMPNGTTLCVSFRTAFRGRSNRGRNFSIGMVKDQVQGNVAKQIYVDQLQAAYNALIPLAQGLGLVWMVASRIQNKVPLAIGSLAPVLAALVTDVNLDSQRRRLAGRGT